MTLYLFCAFMVAGLINFACSIQILRSMARAGAKVSFFELRWQVHKHLKEYRKIGLENNVKIDWPYYAYKASLAGMIGFAALTLISLGDQSN